MLCTFQNNQNMASGKMEAFDKETSVLDEDEESDYDEGFQSLIERIENSGGSGKNIKEKDGVLALHEQKVRMENSKSSVTKVIHTSQTVVNHHERKMTQQSSTTQNSSTTQSSSIAKQSHQSSSTQHSSITEQGHHSSSTHHSSINNQGQHSSIINQGQHSSSTQHSITTIQGQNSSSSQHSEQKLTSHYQNDMTNEQKESLSLSNASQLTQSKENIDEGDKGDKSWMKFPIARRSLQLKNKEDIKNPILGMEILSGENLLPMDLNGFSDPYVKISQGDTVFYKSSVQPKTLNPTFNDRFEKNIENVSTPLLLQVFDYDKASSDDFLGEGEIYLETLELGKTLDMKIELTPGKDKKLKKQITKKNKSLGSISVRIKLASAEDNISSNSKEDWKIIPIIPYTDVEKAVSEGVNGIQMLVDEIEGKEWLGLDLDGTSDPYVKIIQNDKILYKTGSRKKSVNPVWNHSFKFRLEDPLAPFCIKIFDRDWTPNDEFMGEAKFDVAKCELDTYITKTMQLDPGNDQNVIREFRKRGSIGSISIRFKLSKTTKTDVPDEAPKQKESGGLLSFLGIQKGKRSFSPTGKDELNDSELRQLNGRTAVVHVVLVEAIDVKSEEEGIETDPYCKIRLAKEKKISKGINNSPNKQGFDFSWKEEDSNNFLEIDMFNKNDKFVGCIDLDLLELAPELSHDIWLPVKGSVREGEGQHGKIHIVVTISGSVKPDSVSSLKRWYPGTDWEARRKDQYRMSRAFEDFKDVGMLTVKVLGASGLYGADWDFNSDSLAVVELKNQRFCTHTLYNTLAPDWQKIFTFKVEDINDILEVSVLNEKNNGTFINLGQLKIPLLSIKNSQQKWYKLKDESLLKKAKGNDPEILLEMYLNWNPIRAAWASAKPKVAKYEEKPVDTKFKLATLKHNKNRLKAAYARLNPVRAKQELQSILSWENKKKSAAALLAYIYFIWIFQPWMFLFIILIPFIVNIISGKNILNNDNNDGDYEEEEDEETEEKKTLKEQWQTLMLYGEKMQNILGDIAHTIEKVENLFNFSVPFLSFVAFIVLALVTLIIYTFSLRLVLIFLGIKKMLNRLLVGPTPNKILLFLSRVPDNEQLNQSRELREDKGEGSSKTPRRTSTFFTASSSSADEDQVPQEFEKFMESHSL